MVPLVYANDWMFVEMRVRLLASIQMCIFSSYDCVFFEVSHTHIQTLTTKSLYVYSSVYVRFQLRAGQFSYTKHIMCYILYIFVASMCHNKVYSFILSFLIIYISYIITATSEFFFFLINVRRWLNFVSYRFHQRLSNWIILSMKSIKRLLTV